MALNGAVSGGPEADSLLYVNVPASMLCAAKAAACQQCRLHTVVRLWLVPSLPSAADIAIC
jgi:hypothetical protein